jgi:serine/threonine protein kinase
VDGDRWRRVNELFHAALDEDASRRTAFLDEACGGDTALRDEVDSLLRNHDETTTFLEAPAFDVARHLLDDAAAPHVGRQIGAYVISRKIGEGGMGIVYLAEDTRLGRQVAIKALAPQFTRDEARRARLRREARTAAALSDPGIATVYALEESGDELFIVSEFVSGRTLREELAHGPLPIEAVLEIAIAIARPLAAAHERGIVHRDLKPENVMRTDTGAIKILDFGLARFQPLPGAAASATHLTQAGTLLGTPAYMSPEQLRGRDLDFKTDLFSFGVMLYELAGGQHPFAGSDTASTIARVLETEPPEVSTLNAACPAELNQIIGKALRKEPAERYETTRDLVADLERLRDRMRSGALAPPRSLPGPAPRLHAGAYSPRWWWQVHQVVVAVVDFASLVPLWGVREWIGGAAGALLFYLTLVAAIVAGTMRLHLWFSSRYYVGELAAQRARLGPWIRWAEAGFVLLLLAAGAAMAGTRAGMATLLVSIAVASVIGFTVIEPATTRAAFRKPVRTSGRSTKREPRAGS